ncbi:hypothetical protein DSO57_1002843 [Entomophthora muscae]|uniref:Uncharacterized protein n=1 Tax=Entomophthora muscae TaxID=34485 RepID=A0ACC2RZX9_9FUNG|nr:hypothetical protein DSO57_1002843 [Entomophthora muscae]
MNVASDILDNNLLFIKEGDLCPSASTFEFAKGNGLVSPEMASEPLFSSTGFKPGPSFGSANTDLLKTSVNANLSQSLPSAQVSSQSLFYNVNLNCLGVTLGDIGNVGEAGNIFCSILGPLVAAPAVIEAQLTSWSPPYVGLFIDYPSYD